MPVSNSARDKLNIMESKILIDINYASREPQVIIQHKESDDPRDKLIAMFAGQAMPGVRDGYCRIERSHSAKDTDFITITPLDPIEAVKHVKAIKRLALENACIDTAGVKEMIEKQELSENILSEPELLKQLDDMCVQSLSPDAYQKWSEIMWTLKGNRQAFKKVDLPR